MSITRAIYLLLAIFGLVMTWYYNLQFIAESGGSFDVAEFIAAGATNAAAQSLSWDLAIACITGLTWIYFESKRMGLRFFWVYIIRWTRARPRNLALLAQSSLQPMPCSAVVFDIRHWAAAGPGNPLQFSTVPIHQRGSSWLLVPRSSLMRRVNKLQSNLAGCPSRYERLLYSVSAIK